MAGGTRDPLIALFMKNRDVLRMLGRVWELLYIEGNAPDIGKRRENFIKLLLRYEFGLEVVDAPATERQWDFKVRIGSEWYAYSLKTTERLTVVKVAWDGFPSWERAESFRFEYPILYVMGNRGARSIDMYVFTPELIERVRARLGRRFWKMPRSGTNPRGFGISTAALRRLIELAEHEGNHVGETYEPMDNMEVIREEYWKGWYYLLRRLAGPSGPPA